MKPIYSKWHVIRDGAVCVTASNQARVSLHLHTQKHALAYTKTCMHMHTLALIYTQPQKHIQYTHTNPHSTMPASAYTQPRTHMRIHTQTCAHTPGHRYDFRGHFS